MKLALTCRWHIFGYSRGGTLARVLANKHPEKVLSATSIGGPQRGCPACDAVEESTLYKYFLKLFQPKEAKQITEMSQNNMAEINKKYPIGVPDGVSLCAIQHKVPVRHFRGKIGDPTYVMHRVLGPLGRHAPNYSQFIDGVVASCSAGYGPNGDEGIVLKATDHHDIINQSFGLAMPIGITLLKDQLAWVLVN